MNERARQRLEMAKRLLALDPAITPDSILRTIQNMERKQRDSLRSAVDWIEDYERHQRKLNDQG